MSAHSKEPIACRLGGTRYEQRIAANMALASRSLVSTTRDGLTLTLTYHRDAADAVRAMVSAESNCCPFLAFGIVENADTIVVDIRAPEGAADVADDLFAQFAPGTASPTVASG